MQTKTYFASSVPAALEVARQELGADALLVDSKPAPAEARNFGRLEVTFAYDAAVPAPKPIPQPAPALSEPVRPAAAEPAKKISFASVFQAAGAARLQQTSAQEAAPSSPPRSSSQPVAPVKPVAPVQAPQMPRTAFEAEPAGTELDEIRRQISALRQAVGRTAVAPVEEQSYGTETLSNSGIDPEIAREVASAAARRPGNRRSALVQELSARIPQAGFPEMTAGDSRVLAFVGPAGRGKSTALVKLAVQYGLAKRIPVRIYSAGAHGVGCAEQMARYAALIGVPFQNCESLENLNMATNDGWKGLALIDTPGLSPADGQEIAEFERFFARRPEIETHLVLRADTHPASLANAVSRFAGMKPARLLFTGMDEALSPGAMITTLIRSGIPAVFTGTGPQIPDDLQELNGTALADAVCGEDALAAVAA